MARSAAGLYVAAIELADAVGRARKRGADGKKNFRDRWIIRAERRLREEADRFSGVRAHRWRKKR